MSVAMSGIDRTSQASRAGSIKNAILIAGPTASGKSRLALDLARREHGVIVNTDSMQVYSQLRILTARPSEDDLAATPHLLYGHVDPSFAYSTGQWLRDVNALIAEGAFANRRPIFVGGTGLYFKALVEGFSIMPDIPQHIRERWRYRLNEEGAPRLHRILMSVDPTAAMRLQAGDGHRIVRALEVFEASGRSIVDWQAENAPALIDRPSAQLRQIEVERSVLTARINDRFDDMIQFGAVAEVKDFLALNLDPSLPAMRAIGVAEISAFLAGGISQGEAVERAKAATRQYAKRQATWFRNQLGTDWRTLPPL